MESKLFEAALGIQSPWYVSSVDLDTAAQTLTIRIDLAPGSRFSVEGAEGAHPVHDTLEKHCRHLNFFQHECFLVVRTPREKLPDGSVHLVEPDWAGRLRGFTLLFEALVLTLAREMTFTDVARLTGESRHRMAAIFKRYVVLALEEADFSGLMHLAIDKTSRAKGHDNVTLAADAERRAVLFVTEGKDATTIERLAADLRTHGGDPEAIESVSIDMSPAFIKGCEKYLPNAQITFDKFHVIAQASRALDATRCMEQLTALNLKGLRWKLLRDYDSLSTVKRAEVDALMARMSSRRTARAWSYREQLREILGRKQINVVAKMLWQWCTNVMRSKVEPMKQVARMICKHFDRIIAWARTWQTNGFLEALNCLFQSAKRRARGYGNFETIRTVIFLIAGKLDFSKITPHVAAQ